MTDGRSSEEVIILGIDPGTTATGYGVVARRSGGAVSLVECGVIRTSTKETLANRIRENFEGVAGRSERHAPVAVSVRDVIHATHAPSPPHLGHARVASVPAHHDPNTSSPGWRSVTLLPTASTTPATSVPRTGVGGCQSSPKRSRRM